MNEITSVNVHQFWKKFRLTGGRIQRVALRFRPGRPHEAEIRLIVRDAVRDQRIRMRLRMEGVEEYRFQRRPGQVSTRLQMVQIGFFEELTYINFDAYPVDGPPKVMDFRASDCYLAARQVSWEIVEKA